MKIRLKPFQNLLKAFFEVPGVKYIQFLTRNLNLRSKTLKSFTQTSKFKENKNLKSKMLTPLTLHIIPFRRAFKRELRARGYS